MELFSLEGKSVLPVPARWLTEVMSCHLLHCSITDTEQAHTLLEGAEAISPRKETLVFVLPGHGLHPSPLVLFFPCSSPSVLSYLLLWALGAFLPCFHIPGLFFFCFSLPFGNPFYLSHAELLPAPCFHLSSSSCCLCVLFCFGFLLSLNTFLALAFPSPPSYLLCVFISVIPDLQ